MFPPSAGRKFTFLMRSFCPAGETAPTNPWFTETGCYRIVSSNPGLFKLNHSVVSTCFIGPELIPCALRPAPYALRPAPYALRPMPYALRPMPLLKPSWKTSSHSPLSAMDQRQRQYYV
jgi:hypothetical protein